MQSKHLGTITVRGHQVRFVLDTHARAGCYSPELHVYLHGPNGSPAGFGPKGWPALLVRAFEPGRAWRRRNRPGAKPGWSNMLAVRLPHLTWWRAYRLRRIGAIRLYVLIERAYNRAVA